MADAVAQTAAPPAPDGVWGERYGRYQLIERIGKGGMAEIFRAVAGGVEGWSRQFVVKRIRPEKSQSREFIRMFCEEARLCALLHHPNIVQVYDFGQIDGSYFLAMEYLRGKDLSTVLRALRAMKQAVAPGLAAFVAQQAALGLQHAHTLVDGNGQAVRIVHRDVTPSNIMLLRSGGVKLLDFGIAKDVGQEPAEVENGETGAGQVKGKLAYLAPEQVRNLPLDGRADLFALGVVLWEMLTGQRLFSADSEFQTMRNVLTQPVPAPSTVRPDVPAALDAVVARALARDREQRFATAAELAVALEEVVHSERVVAGAIPALLQRLFGDEAASIVPTPRPGSLRPVGDGAKPVTLSAVLRTRSSSGGEAAAPASSSIPLGLQSIGSDAEVSLQIIESEAPSIDGAAIARWRRRRAMAAIGALVFAGAGALVWRATRAPRAQETPPAATVVAAPAATSAPIAPTAPAPPLTGSGALEPAPVKSAATRAVARPRATKRAAARVQPSALTLNPFE